VKAQEWARRTGSPATVLILALLGAIFLAAWFSTGSFGPNLALPTANPTLWGFLTFPFASVGDGRDLFWFLLMMLWLFWVGGAMEREVGSAKLVGFWLLMSLLFGLSMIIGTAATKAAVTLMGPGLPVSALTVAWGVRNPTECIRLWCIIPILGKWLAILTVALVLFGYGTGAPLMGLFAALPLAFAYAFAINAVPGFAYARGATWSGQGKQQLKKSERMDKGYYEDVKRREKEREERERLRKLFEDSLGDDKQA
jgi:hypothetical protein